MLKRPILVNSIPILDKKSNFTSNRYTSERKLIMTVTYPNGITSEGFFKVFAVK